MNSRFAPIIKLACTSAVALAATTGSASASSTAAQYFSTAGNYRFIVPDGISSLEVAVAGAAGGHANGCVAGRGDEVVVSLPVTGQELLTLSPAE